MLAFLFRTFEAEGFEIPTGSMAPTLMGMHKDFECPQCGYAYQVGASHEVDLETGRQTGDLIKSATCPMCRFPTRLDQDNPLGRSYRTYSGDRIQAAKFTYYGGQEAQRWDVTLFKYPHGAETNYIKRLVGLPNETLSVWHGDLYVRPQGESAFKISRKPAEKVRATLQEVYDNDYLLEKLIERGWPLRWQSRETAGGAAWQAEDQGRRFSVTAKADAASWLAYEHTPPSWNDWQALEQGPLPAGTSVSPQLVTDFCAYNTGATTATGPPKKQALFAQGLHWVGDLAIDFTCDVAADTGKLLIDLVEAGRHYQCAIELSSGEASLSIDGQVLGKAHTPVQGSGEYELSFANVDDQLFLWVDGDVIEFPESVGGGLPYPTPSAARPQPDDLRPARIGAQGAKVDVRHLRLRRDIYYIACRAPRQFPDYSISIDDYDPNCPLFSQLDEQHIRRMMSDPNVWGFFDGRRPVEFVMGANQFLMFGDNSSASMDSRLWLRSDNSGDPALVDRSLLIGKAMFVYWPHAWETPVSIDVVGYPVPFYPNFRKFRLVR
ncbi:MAG: S26 family signal peptidase [Pirellulales bacterium]|nr:S26 family signal peptidase [Pirellulales bacterium]